MAMRTLVTGANGHLGYNLVGALLRAGHSVRASVRSLADPARTDRLRALGDVELVEADVLQPKQLRAAMEGIDVVYHAAAVYAYVGKGREQEILDASILGAENALRAAADARVRKVVMTSSAVTLPLTTPDAPPVDERDWTTDLRIPYMRAKTEGEQVAWRVAREVGVHLVTVLPGGFLGPGFERNTPSIDFVEMVIRGGLRMGAPDANFPAVDVRDVVSLHLLVGERDCSGRFIAINDLPLPSLRTIAETLNRIDPSIRLPLMKMPAAMVGMLPLFDRLNHRMLGSPLVMTPEMIATLRGKIWNASNARAKREFGWRPTVSLEQTLRDTLDTIRARDAQRQRTPATA